MRKATILCGLMLFSAFGIVRPMLSESSQNLTQKLGASVIPVQAMTASGTYGGAPVALPWESGQYAPPVSTSPQWIQLDLGAPYLVSKIALTVSQSPAGPTSHEILGSLTPTAIGSMKLLATINGYTTNGQVLQQALWTPTLVRYIAIETMYSPSWVGWGGITVYTDVVLTNPSTPLSPVSATASASYTGFTPLNAFKDAAWDSGAFAPQWIQGDLGQPYNIGQIRLNVIQSPAGQTINNILGGPTPTNLFPLLTINETTSNGQWIDVPVSNYEAGIQYLEVQTSQSPSWVGWQDIQVYQSNGLPESVLPALAVGASNTAAGSNPNYAADGILTDTWNSGGDAPQWIQLDLGQPYPISAVKLLVSQTPAGETDNCIFGGNATSTGDAPNLSQMTLMTCLDGDTSNGQWLDAVFPAANSSWRYIAVETTVSPAWVAWYEIQVYSPTAAVAAAPKPQYFGYWCSDCSSAGNGNYITKYASTGGVGMPNVNIAFVDDTASEAIPSASTICPAPTVAVPTGGWNGAAYNEYCKVREAAELGISAVVALDNLEYSTASGSTGELDPVYWDQFVTLITPYINSVAAFYPFDEPVPSDTTIVGNLEATNKILKTTFPQTPVAVLFSYQSVPPYASTSSFSIPQGYDWVGFDCHDGTWSNCFGNPIPAYLSALEAAMNPAQKLILVPDAALDGQQSTPSAITQATFVTLANSYYNYATTDPRVVFIMPFEYQTYSARTGVQTMPLVSAVYQGMGNYIIGN
jgi:hypothetical protein